jgi:hypothetical protein
VCTAPLRALLEGRADQQALALHRRGQSETAVEGAQLLGQGPTVAGAHVDQSAPAIEQRRMVHQALPDDQRLAVRRKRYTKSFTARRRQVLLAALQLTVGRARQQQRAQCAQQRADAQEHRLEIEVHAGAPRGMSWAPVSRADRV